jgi:peptidoglycan hydrolase-like protein with peptidoglycan-binding domain
MSTEQEDIKRKAIFELQLYLNQIAKAFPHLNIPTIMPDGIYDPLTKESVIKFCKAQQLPETGEVDKEVWDRIVEVYNQVSGNAINPIMAFPSNEYIIKEGDNNMLVSLLQVMLQALGLNYKNCPMVNVTGLYDELTVNGVKNIQKIAEITETGDVNLFTWNHIVTLFNELQLPNLHLPQIIVDQSAQQTR